MKLVYGFGYNDVKETGAQSKFYKTWKSMLERCYSEKLHERQPTYVGCTVCVDWLTFSKFKAWMETQDWEDKQLDKDILVSGNKIYSPDTCVFISKELNSFLLDSNSSRGLYPIGVCLNKAKSKFVSYCSTNGKQIYLGSFNTPEEAHKVWLDKKLELAHIHASKQSDFRVSKAVIERYQNYKVV